MSENCTHDCSSCQANCESRKEPESLLEKPNQYTHISKMIGVISGKGGVGKSLVTAMLAVSEKRAGKKAAIMDADITGPSIPKMFGVTKKAEGTEQGILPVFTKTGIPVMSINLLLENDTDPVVWRGPVIAGAVKQFYTDVLWGDVDYMFVDMPPGTGDVALTAFQSLPLDGIIVVASPQELVGMIVEKAVKMAAMMDIPVVALVENMSYFTCPDCGAKHSLFGPSHAAETAEKHGINTVCYIPLDPAIAALSDMGDIESISSTALECLSDAVKAI